MNKLAQKSDGKERSALIPFISVMAVCFCLLMAWRMLITHADEQIRRQTLSETLRAQEKIAQHMRFQIFALQQMAKVWEPQKDTAEKKEPNAQNYLNYFAGFAAMEWVDTPFHPRWIIPWEGREKEKAFALDSEEVQALVREAFEKKQEVTVSRSFDSKNGSKAFLICFLKGKNPLGGFIVIIGSFHYHEFLDGLLKDMMESGYEVSLLEGDELVYGESEYPLKWIQDRDIQLPGGALWHIRVWPNSKLLSKLRPSISSLLTLGVGFFLLFILAFYFSYRAKNWAKELGSARQALNYEIAQHKKVQEARLQLAAIVESSNDAIIGKDLDGTITSWNKAAEKLFGYTAQEMTGKSLGLLIPPDQREQTGRVMKLIQSGEGLERYETQWMRKDGSFVDVAVSISPIRESGGNLVGASTIARDITDNKKAEAAIVQQAKDLARSNAELEQFAYVASHDLQEPLRVIASYAQLLDKHYPQALDEKGREFIGYLSDGAQRAQQLVHDLLQYSRVGRHGKPFSRTDCSQILYRVLANLKLTMEENDVTVKAGELPMVLGDEVQLTQLFQNLIVNAIKFRKPSQSPRIDISAVRNGHEWTFSVKDNGIGIDPQYFERIFVIFQRLHTREEYPGTGIGLATCKKIVENHGGRIWVECEAGKGSTFCFTLPYLRYQPSVG